MAGNDLHKEEGRGEEEDQVQLDWLQSSEPLFHSHDTPAKPRAECFSSILAHLHTYRLPLLYRSSIMVKYTIDAEIRGPSPLHGYTSTCKLNHRLDFVRNIRPMCCIVRLKEFGKRDISFAQVEVISRREACPFHRAFHFVGMDPQNIWVI